MSIASDIRGYADNAVTEGRKVLDSTLSSAQAQLNDVTGNVQSIAGKASDAVNDLRASAEKAINVDAVKSAVEPYLAQAKTYQASITDRAEAIFTELRKDPRFAKAVEVADSVSGVVVGTVQERVVKPVQSFTGRGTTKPAPRKTAARKPAPTKAAARKPAATKPAAKPAAKSTARKTTARKTATKRTTS